MFYFDESYYIKLLNQVFHKRGTWRINSLGHKVEMKALQRVWDFESTNCNRLSNILNETQRYLAFMLSSDPEKVDRALQISCEPEFKYEEGEVLLSKINKHRQFVHDHVYFAELTLLGVTEFLLKKLDEQDCLRQDSVALYRKGDSDRVVAKLKVRPSTDMRRFEFCKESILYEKEPVVSFEGHAYSQDRERLAAFRVGQIYNLSDGTVLLTRSKKTSWAAKAVRVVYGGEIGKEKGFRDIAAMLILCSDPTKIEETLSALWDVELRKEKHGFKHYFSGMFREFELPLEIQVGTFEAFEEREFGGLDHGNYRQRVRDDIEKAATKYPEVAKAWKILDMTCDPRKLVHADELYVPL